jgi:kojibiose phosphorylase
MSDPWAITETAYAAATGRAYEGLFTLGSGYLHVRGSLEEHLRALPQDANRPAASPEPAIRKSQWGTYVPGVFGRHPHLNNQMLNLPWFLGLAPSVAGERLDLPESKVTDYCRELRLRDATLERTLRWHTRAGAVVTLTFARFVSAERPSLCVQRLTLASDRAVTVAVTADLDADVVTNGFDHFTAVTPAAVPSATGGDLACTVVTNGDDTVEMRSRVISPPATWAGRMRPRGAALTADLRLAPGVQVVIEKRTAVATSRDLTKSPPESTLAAAAGLTYDQLHAEHAARWAARWARTDVVIEGDPVSQYALRTSLFHLLRAHVTGDSRVAIDAKGYAGEGYCGRFFWDTEACLLPFFLYTDPPRARTLVDFRVNNLPGARANAKRYQFPGARYPWESDHRGVECCMGWQYADHQVHVTADVVYALAHYARATGDEAFLRGPAATVIVETARYWLQRVDWRPGEKHASLTGVMGPNEYHPLGHNNAYTNRLVRFSLELAAEIGAAGGATPEERKNFAATAAALPIMRAKDGVLVLEHEGFELLSEPQFERFWTDRSKGFGPHVTQERLYRSKGIKQADVIMMMMLFPKDFTDTEVRRAWDYYLPYTTHDSSLSACPHALVAKRLGLHDQAWKFWQRGSGNDLDVAHGHAADGLHIAGAGANWQMVVFGFAGLTTAMNSDLLSLDPRLPDHWQRLAFPMVWKQVPLGIDITLTATTVSNRGDRALEVRVWGVVKTVAAGGQAVFNHGSGGAGP